MKQCAFDGVGPSPDHHDMFTRASFLTKSDGSSDTLTDLGQFEPLADVGRAMA
jgi:hypothetical protein